MTNVKKTVVIPFSGFYESTHNSLFDREIESLFEYDDQGNSNIPDEFYWANINYQHMRLEYSKRYVENFNELIKTESDFDLGLTFESLQSPREYNFTTDRIFCYIDQRTIRKLFAYAIDHMELFDQCVKDNFTSCDGFCSYYSNNLQDWVKKPLGDYDHNEIGLLLEVLIKGNDIKEESFEAYNLMESEMCNGVITNLLDEATPREFLDFAYKQREAGKPLKFKKRAA